ncbi:MAG: hypothetical protein J7M18_07180 [Candidatus Eremiobacteraeota bacterium]|nr:hypothetical protein [Candidatus Eremiobacteraeota bacterium]
MNNKERLRFEVLSRTLGGKEWKFASGILFPGFLSLRLSHKSRTAPRTMSSGDIEAI